MSGGVDSSVAAHLLLEQGHDVVGVFMRHGEPEPARCDVPAGSQLPVLPSPSHKQGCCSASDAEDGRRVAQRLGIPYYALNLREDFGRIIDYFVGEYGRGRTPNPCVVCNTWLKFGKLFDYADSIGAECVATGHYARLAADPEHNDRIALHRGRDAGKDQSYVLFGVPRARLARMLLPVGGYEKSRIRELAADLGLRVADKRDSQEICFVAAGEHARFVRQRRGASDESDAAGDLVTLEGKVVGRHPGIESFTIGQRKGIGVAMREPHYVVRIEAESRRVVIGPKSALGVSFVRAERANWHADRPTAARRCLIQYRYNTPAAPGIAEAEGEGFSVRFDEPQQGVAPGQAIVLYDADRLLGGGWIAEAGR